MIKGKSENSMVLVSLLLMSLMILSVSLPNANAASMGPNGPGTVVSVTPGDYSWSNPDSAKASDNIYATAVSASASLSSYRLKATNYGFSIPTGATVTGIQVDVDRLKDSSPYSSVKDMEILIVKSDGSLGTNNKADTGTNWPTSDTTKSYGGATDLWGEVWSPADIDSSNFGVVVRVSFSWSGGGVPSATAYVDYISITVYYSPPSAECVTASTGGSVCFAADAGGFTSLTASPLSSISTPPPAGLTFPYALFSFTISDLSPGATVTVTLTLPAPLPSGSFSYWKFQSGAWTQFPGASLDSTRTIITLTLTADSTGTVTDPGGPAITPPPPSKLVVSHVPVGGVMLPSVGLTVLLPWAIVLSLLGVLSVEAFLVRRRAKRR